MVKQLVLFIQLIGMFFYQLIISGDVTVSQTIPQAIQSGSEVTVEITVNKGDVAGFAKVQQDFPKGFQIEPIETKGATFSFKENRIKFIWMALPSEKEFTISYKVKPLEGTVGDFSLAGKFSFIDESERKNIDISSSNFTVTTDVIADNTVEDNSVEEVTEEPVVAIEVSSNREIVEQEEGKYLVTLTINKKGVEGFAKIAEDIPEGFIATESESAGGVFSMKEQQMKILWMAVPKGDDLKIVYQLTASEGTANNSYELRGAFSYLENDNTKKHIVEMTSFDLNRELLVAENTEEEIDGTIETTTEEEKTSDNEVKEEVTELEEEVVTVNETEEEPANNTTETDITSIPVPETAVSYKVQVGAGHQTVPANYFVVKFSLQDNVSTENHEGWIKYVVGSFTEYKAARDKRNVVRNNVKRAFVTAYNSGKRITVQEALMISNQKWYK